MTVSKWKALSSLYGNFATIFFGSIVLPALTNFDKVYWQVVLLGGILTILFAWFSLLAAEEGKL